MYIEEIPGGARTITGVPTSITAFIGRALRGPVNESTSINSFGDFERIFGGLWVESTMSYAARDFYMNGGSQAIVIRLHNGATPATINLPTGQVGPNDSLQFVAANVGAWGNGLSVTIDHNVKQDLSTPGNYFNITISDRIHGAMEKFLNVSIASADARYVPPILEQSSNLVRVLKNNNGNWIVPGERPQPGTIIVANTGLGTDGNTLTANQFFGPGMEARKEGIYALEKADLFNLLCIPPLTRDADTPDTVYQEAMKYCFKRRAMLIVDPPAAWSANKETAATAAGNGLGTLNLSGDVARNAALFFPRVIEADIYRDGQLDAFVPCGIVAGIIARTDAQRGVWKAPAGVDTVLNGIQGLEVNLTDNENGLLNPLGINCLRSFPTIGCVVWGARTLYGADQLADEYKYICVRRLALFIEESLYRGTQWVVFEPNDEPLWAQIRLNVGAFLHNLFREGAFQGSSPREAYFVKCDKETTTQNDINLGIVNIVVGFAPLKPAEFVMIKIQQMAGQVQA